MDPVELRKHQRFETHCSILFVWEEGTGEGIVYNLSARGCAIESDVNVPKGTYLNLRIQLPDQESPVLVELAAVRWSTRREFGVEFVMMVPESQRRIGRFLGTKSAV